MIFWGNLRWAVQSNISFFHVLQSVFDMQEAWTFKITIRIRKEMFVSYDYTMKYLNEMFIYSSLIYKKLFVACFQSLQYVIYSNHQHIPEWPLKSANRNGNDSVLIWNSWSHIKLRFLFERIQTWIMTLSVRTIRTRVH